MPRSTPPGDPSKPGGKVRVARQSKGLSQTEAADLAKVSSRYLSEVERGRKTPSLEWLMAFATAIGVHPGELNEVFGGKPGGK